MIKVQDLTKIYPGDVVAVQDVSFHVPAGHTLALIGPSGCGKTTTLKMLNRLQEPTAGDIFILGDNILDQDPVQVRRQIGYVLQSGGLFPHWTVARNVALVPTLLGWEKERQRERTDALLDLVGLEPADYRDRYPLELSGGQRQRVGIARALAADPPVILLDEPFSALDNITRRQMQQEFQHWKEKLGKTMVFVTHDLNEAFLLADEILLMKEGIAQQCATPDELRRAPANEFVREFIEMELE